MVAAIIQFFVAVVLLLVLSRLTNHWLLSLLGERFYNILLWPGVVVHELSHLLGALITLTKVTGVALLPKAPASGGQVLGSVSHAATRNPVVLILISIFPLLGGSFVLWVLAQLLLPGGPTAAPALVVPAGWQISLFAPWWQFVREFAGAFQATAWQSWLFTYLAITIAAHLAPSNHDLGFTAAGFAALSILFVVAEVAAGQASPALGAALGRWVAQALGFFVPLLTYALGLLVVVAFVIGAVYGLKRLNQRAVW